MCKEDNILENEVAFDGMENCNCYCSGHNIICLPVSFHDLFSELVDIVLEYEKLSAEYLRGEESVVRDLSYSDVLHIVLTYSLFEYKRLLYKLKNNSKPE